jgi:hypothetical protein
MNNLATSKIGADMKIKKGDAIFVEFYGVRLYGRVLKVAGQKLTYRNEIRQVFEALVSEATLLTEKQAVKLMGF